MKLGRNDRCHCGSGKKYKKCCLTQDEENARAETARLKAERVAARFKAPVLPDLPAFTPPPPDPEIEAWNAMWKEFNKADNPTRIATYRRFLDESEMDEELSFEMLNLLYQDAATPAEREAVDALVEELRARLPDVYRHDQHFYVDWRIEGALISGRLDALNSFAEELPAIVDNIDTFNQIIDALAYHGHLEIVARAMREGWPAVRESKDIMEWAISEFANRARNFEMLWRAQREPSFDPHDAQLLERLNFFLPVEPEMLAQSAGHLTGRTRRDWQLSDFELTPSARAEEAVPYEGVRNFAGLRFEFIGTLHREDGVAYSKAELGSLALQDYLLQRALGKLQAENQGHASFGRPKAKSNSESLLHPLCPDAATLDIYLGRLMGFFNPELHRVAACFELLPAWLRFLQARDLLSAEQSQQTLDGLAPMQANLVKLCESHGNDPARLEAIRRWPQGEPSGD